jgi:hypothetical protein
MSDDVLFLIALPATALAFIGFAGRERAVERGLWRGASRADRQRERDDSPFHPNAARDRRTRPPKVVYLGDAPGDVQHAFKGMVALPWLWIPTYFVAVIAARWFPWQRDHLAVYVEQASPIALLVVLAVFLLARRALVRCDARAARQWGRLAAAAALVVFVPLTLALALALVNALDPHNIAFPFGAVPAAAAIALRTVFIVHAVRLWRAAGRVPSAEGAFG